MILAGLAAEPALWRLAAPGAEGRSLEVEGLRLVTSSRGPWPVAVPGPGQVQALALDPGAEAPALEHLLTGLGFRRAGEVWIGTGEAPAQPLAPGVLEVVLATAEDILSLQGRAEATEIAKRLGPMLVRAASRLRAEAGAAPARLRLADGRVTRADWRLPYAHFFSMEEHDIAWQRFDGTMSGTVTRAAFVSGDAVTVLPYDPIRDRVLVIEQFRAGPLVRGDRRLWQIEAIAGRVDPFETPEEAARREAVEEAGLTLSDLRFVARYYPSPGAVSEYIYTYVALTDLPDGAAGVFGLEEEAEDIRGHLLGFDAFMELVASGEIDNAPLLLTALWLQRERLRLRGS
ncbi:NUDIX domain-containing protein [Stagnihabitans tardus]|nr:NUDIX domain-containing protein [Stagnihabitans tardus]